MSFFQEIIRGMYGTELFPVLIPTLAAAEPRLVISICVLSSFVKLPVLGKYESEGLPNIRWRWMTSISELDCRQKRS
jgi:hypothetical protein